MRRAILAGGIINFAAGRMQRYDEAAPYTRSDYIMHAPAKICGRLTSVFDVGPIHANSCRDMR